MSFDRRALEQMKTYKVLVEFSFLTMVCTKGFFANMQTIAGLPREHILTKAYPSSDGKGIVLEFLASPSDVAATTPANGKGEIDVACKLMRLDQPMPNLILPQKGG